jgi:hypothetical protein
MTSWRTLKTTFCALVLLAPAALAQTADAPALWTGAAGSEAVPGGDHEYPGERAFGEVLADNQRRVIRTARLASPYEANIQGVHVSMPAGTPFEARYAPIAVAVAAPGASSRPRTPEPARGTIIWCALPLTGYAPCFFWNPEGGVHGQALMTGGEPSMRAWLGDATPAPSPELREESADLPPRATRIILQSATEAGYVLQVITQEAGVEYTRSYPRRTWNAWHYMFLAPSQRMRAAPLYDEGGAIRGATVEFTREPAS